MEIATGIPVNRVCMRWAMRLGVAVLMTSALWLLALSFFIHITPDTSAYLLQARTFVETLNRFAFSHDSKGIVLMFLLALPVKWLGTTMVAGALVQAVAYLLVACAIWWLLRARPRVALAAAALWLIAAFSPLMWGGRVRPEDFGMAFAMLALLGAYRNSRSGMALCGAMAAVSFFTKTSLCIAPLLVGVVAALMARNGREKVVRMALLAGGVAVVATLIVGWIFMMDDAGQWWRQTVQWPLAYKRAASKSAFSRESVGNLFALLQAARLQGVWAGCLVGLFWGWKRGATRLVVLIAVLLLAEGTRVVIECEPWPYELTGMLPAMVLGCSLCGCDRGGRGTGRGTMLTLLVLVPVLAVTLPDAARATRLRVLGGARTPMEVLAQRMAPLYTSGEQIMVNGNNYQPLLYLHAPRPYPILPLHFHAVSQVEYEAAAYYFMRHPPEWIIDSNPAASPVSFRCIGAEDQLAYAYVAGKDAHEGKLPTGMRLGARYPVARPVASLPEMLLQDNHYTLMVDIGLYQAWRLGSGKESEFRIQGQ